MNIINRTMESEDFLSTKDIGFNYKSQASINSDGCLTLRNYNPNNKNTDEIVIFTREETTALFRLIRKIAVAVETMTDRSSSLPF